MNPPKQANPDLDRYFAQAGSWSRDQRDALERSQRRAWWVAAAATVVAVLLALALALLIPLKTVEPLTLLVDRQTGYVQALKPLDPQLVAADAALTQSFLVQYVIAREGYDADSLQADYRKVGLWSTGDARTSYVARMQATNPDSPLARYPRSTVVDVTVKSVTPMSRGTALVRYATRRRDAGGQPQALQDWVAVVRYGFTGAPMSVADRMVNPLGFQVSRYRRSVEVLPAPDPQPVVAGPAGYPRIVPQPAQTTTP